jgi:hypothetical protein
LFCFFQGTIATALFARGPWLYVRLHDNGKTGYIPRIICSLYQKQRMIKASHPSTCLSSLTKDDEHELKNLSTKIANYYLHTNKSSVARDRSHSSAIISAHQEATSIDRSQEHTPYRQRNTYTLPRQIRSNLSSNRDRRLTTSSLNCPLSISNPDSLGIDQQSNGLPLMTSNHSVPLRDTDSSSTQDSGYSESTQASMVQQRGTPPATDLSNTPSASQRTKVGLTGEKTFHVSLMKYLTVHHRFSCLTSCFAALLIDVKNNKVFFRLSNNRPRLKKCFS